MALVEVKVPDIGDFEQVEVIELLVKAGDSVALEQSLITVESDKASMEIPSSHAGVIRELRVKIGDKVSKGSLLAMVEATSSSVPLTGGGTGRGLDAAPATAPAALAPMQATPSSLPQPFPVQGEAAGVTVVVPDIGDFDSVAVIEVFVKPGDRVKVEQSLVTVESDKASMEIPSSHAGQIEQVLVKLGDKVSKGMPLVTLSSSLPLAGGGPGRGLDAAPASAAATASPPPQPSPLQGEGAMPAHDPTAPLDKLPHASPSIRKLARELGVPLAEVGGNGPKGRITQADLQAFVKRVMAGDVATAAQQSKAPKAAAAPAAAGGAFPGLLPWPQIDFTKFGAVERRDLSRIKKISGANLHRNWVLIPHVTNHDDADITELEAFRVTLNRENEKSGIKVTMLAFLIKACVAALKKFPDFNASLDGDALVLKKYFHIGFAADTPGGLVVPVIRDVDQKGILQISTEMNELAKKARDGKLGPADMSGGCFSISSLGGIGGTYFTPIINAPEVAILGVCRSSLRPVWNGKEFEPRLMLPLSLSWDHRVIDGASAARFNSYLSGLLADFRRIVL